MFIRAFDTGTIQLVSKNENEDCVHFAGDVPDDFFKTFGLGKYQFLNGSITLVEGWIMPDFNELPQ